MVKAYLRYIQESVLSGLFGNLTGIKLVKIKVKGEKTRYIVSACNEVVNFTNLHTGQVDYQIYDKEAMHGQVTCIVVSSSLIAIGYTSGTVLVYSLEEPDSLDANEQKKATQSNFELLHQFSFHKSTVTSMIFSEENT
jgi:WD40 repeat protein